MNVEVKLIQAGYCSHPEYIVHGNLSARKIRFPTLVVQIKHPKHGIILFDTGYAETLIPATKNFPFNLYNYFLRPRFRYEDTAKAQLLLQSIQPEQVRHIVVSHFHPDHISGLMDFSKAEIWCSHRALELFNSQSPFRNLLNGFFPKLLDNQIKSRLRWVSTARALDISERLSPFKSGYDIFGDESLITVELPGHTRDQVGLLLRTETEGDIFFVADACWTIEAIRCHRLPHPVTRIITHNPKKYRLTIKKLQELQRRRPDLAIIPSHCAESIRQFEERA